MRQDIFPSVYVIHTLLWVATYNYPLKAWRPKDWTCLSLHGRLETELNLGPWHDSPTPCPLPAGEFQQHRVRLGSSRVPEDITEGPLAGGLAVRVRPRGPCQSHSLQTGVKGSFSQRGPCLCVRKRAGTCSHLTPFWDDSGWHHCSEWSPSSPGDWPGPGMHQAGRKERWIVLAGRLSTFRFQEERTCLGGPAAHTHTTSECRPASASESLN